jgi:hypothetical protein
VYPERTTDHGKATVKLYHLRLRVECTLFANYKAGREPTRYWHHLVRLRGNDTFGNYETEFKLCWFRQVFPDKYTIIHFFPNYCRMSHVEQILLRFQHKIYVRFAFNSHLLMKVSFPRKRTRWCV